MKLIACCALLMVAGAAKADDAKAALHDALETQATPPAKPPVLPDSASDRAKYVQQNVAHGKKGAEEKAAHDADAAGTDADAAKSAEGAAARAARSANADSNAAAGQARATKARGGNVPGSGGPNGHPHGPPATHPH
jgi:hypothetical protein